MRTGCQSIKSRAILGIALVLSRGRIPSPRGNLSTLSGLIEYFLPLYIFFLEHSCCVLRPSVTVRDKLTAAIICDIP
jgi:hypothetical protein